MYVAWEWGKEGRGNGAAWLSSTEGRNSFTAGWESTFYRNPELKMRENEDYFLYGLHSYYVYLYTNLKSLMQCVRAFEKGLWEKCKVEHFLKMNPNFC